MNKRRDRIHRDTESHMRWQKLGPWGDRLGTSGGENNTNTRLKNPQHKLMKEKNYT